MGINQAAAAATAALGLAAMAQAPVDDPLPDIPKSELTVAAIPFLRAPETFDPARPQGTNDPRTRIQYLQSVPGFPGRLAFNDTRGVLYLTNTDARRPVVYLDLREQGISLYSSALPNESGFMGFAFHPQFAEAGKPGHGKLYTAFTASAGSGEPDYADEAGLTQASVVREWTATAPGAWRFAGTSRELLRVGEFAANHNVGTIAFNPAAEEGDADFGMLYIGFGDGGSAHDPRDYGQDRTVPLGAIARIDPLATEDGASYGIPADNPFVAAENVAPEIWAFGLRHPQQFSWDADGRMFVSDIGQDQIEEVNLGAAGANYGWRLREGTFATGRGVGRTLGPVYPRPAEDEQPFVYPIAQYDHDDGFAIGGGFVYRGANMPGLRGKYLFTDFPRGRLFAIDADDLPVEPDSEAPHQGAPIEELRFAFDGIERELTAEAGFPNTYRPGSLRVDARLSVDANGELYLLTKGDGWIRRLVANAATNLTPYRGRNTGDFNGDGKDDVLLRHRDGRWTYYPMNGRFNIGSERGSSTLPADRAWRFTGVGDFDGDGRDDVLLRHADGRWRYFPMDGRRARAAAQGAPALTRFPEWTVAGAGDFNGDGHDDVLARNASGAWRLYALEGDAVVPVASGSARITANPAWQLVGTADFDGDARHDVLLRHAESGAWTYYPMSGREPIAAGRGFANLTKMRAWQPVAVGDFNGDGNADVMVRHAEGAWHYYPMAGRRSIAAERGRADLPQDLDRRVAAVGDFNGDGNDDLMLRHANGTWSYYPMDGRQVLAAEQGAARITRNRDWMLP